MSWKRHQVVRHYTKPDFHCRHHIVNRKDGGNNTEQNLLRMWKSREVLFHQLFGNRTLTEASELLMRVARAKSNQRLVRHS